MLERLNEPPEDAWPISVPRRIALYVGGLLTIALVAAVVVAALIAGGVE